jgi:hypothetical protein
MRHLEILFMNKITQPVFKKEKNKEKILFY